MTLQSNLEGRVVEAVREAVAPLQDRMARLETAQEASKGDAANLVRDALAPIHDQFSRLDEARRQDQDRAQAGHDVLIQEIRTCSGDLRTLTAQVTATANRVDQNRVETERRLDSFDTLIQERLENFAKARRVDSGGSGNA